MAYLGITTASGRCAICKRDFPPRTVVYHDPTKRRGSHLAHSECWEGLLAERRASGTMKKPEKAPSITPEQLDPPF